MFSDIILIGLVSTGKSTIGNAHSVSRRCTLHPTLFITYRSNELQLIELGLDRLLSFQGQDWIKSRRILCQVQNAIANYSSYIENFRNLT